MWLGIKFFVVSQVSSAKIKKKKEKTNKFGKQWNPSESRHRFLRSLPLNKPFSTIFDPALTEANKALEHLQKTSEKQATLPA